MTAILLAAACLSQSIHLYSEFRRLAPTGEIVAADRGGRPREIISPALARNAFTSFHLFVNVPAGKRYELHLAQNPDRTVSPEVYLERHHGDLPDLLEKVAQPVQSKGPAVYWLDVWVPAQAPPSRVRLEAQLHVDDRWIIYPLELRVQATQVPAYEPVPGPLPAVAERADASVLGPWRVAVCGTAEPRVEASGPTIRSLIRRNALQDLALAGPNRTLYLDRFCGEALPRDDPEWYLGVRDRLKVPLAHGSQGY